MMHNYCLHVAGLHKSATDSPQSTLPTDGVLDNDDNSMQQHGTIDVSLESSSSSSCMNGHQQTSLDPAHLLPAPPSSMSWSHLLVGLYQGVCISKKIVWIVWRWCLACQSCSGRLFHSVGPAVAKQRSPNWLRDLLTKHVRLSADCKSSIMLIEMLIN